jgi:hypothetical protein
MTALNQDAGQGSYYMDDERNAFRSAGSFAGNYVYMEHGSDFALGAVNPTAEGGFFREGSSMSYGLYLNSSEHGQLASAGTTDPGRIDLFLRSNSGMNWGVRLGYESIEVGALDGSAFDLSVNADLAGANVWLTYVPATDTLTGAAGTEADMQLGATYAYGDHTLFAEYSSDGGNDGDDAATSITVGAGRTMSTDSGMFFYDISLTSESNSGNVKDVSRMAIPVTFGFETAATSWLTWRASIKQSLHGGLEAANGDNTSIATTTVGAGASLTWGSLRVDGTLATVANSAATTLGTNNLMSNISAVYNF